jgi:hypothetical protein
MFYQNRLVCWSIVVKDKPTVDSPFFGAFPSDRINKAPKDFNVNFVFTVAIPVNYTSNFLGIIPANFVNFSKLLPSILFHTHFH